jgi:hypothetical protein
MTADTTGRIVPTLTPFSELASIAAEVDTVTRSALPDLRIGLVEL